MASSFSFSFGGDDIDDDAQLVAGGEVGPTQIAQPPAPPPSAFPVQGKPMLPPIEHRLSEMLSRLPSKIAFSTLPLELDGGETIHLPRRELWDVRVQLMAEDDGAGAERGAEELEPGLGEHDVKTGIYEGGFKSWESSVDLVKVLAQERLSPVAALANSPVRVIELGCGTGLPSLALFQWASREPASQGRNPLSLVLADYNPSVLYLVTLPNILLAWALQQQEQTPILQEALAGEGELELTDEVKSAFTSFLTERQIFLSFLSGGWSEDFVKLLYSPDVLPQAFAQSDLVVIGAETIYSPFAQNLFSEILLSVLRKEQSERPNHQAASIVAAKRLYFGVGGSLDDFVDKMRTSGATVNELREETEGVRRGVVQCILT